MKIFIAIITLGGKNELKIEDAQQSITEEERHKHFMTDNKNCKIHDECHCFNK